eukprot:Em0012g24a
MVDCAVTICIMESTYGISSGLDRSLHRAYFDTTGTAALTTGANETIMVTGMAVDVREVKLIQKTSPMEETYSVIRGFIGR